MEPVTKLADDVDAETLGETVLQALSFSHHHAPWPTDWKNLTAALYLAAGVKSESTFMKGAKAVRIDLEAGDLTVIPTTSKELRNALTPLMNKRLQLSLGSAREVGLALSQAMSICD